MKQPKVARRCVTVCVWSRLVSYPLLACYCVGGIPVVDAAPVAMRLVHVVVLALPVRIATQHVCCCSVPSSTGGAIQHKIVSGCSTARCGSSLIACAECTSTFSEGCSFCGMPQHKTCGTVTACADWCAASVTACDHIACSGCTKCVAEEEREAATTAASTQQLNGAVDSGVSRPKLRCTYWWCDAHPSPWERKCVFESCAGCPSCGHTEGAAQDRASLITSDLEEAFAHYGFTSTLPLLDVRYDNSRNIIEGERSHFVKGDDTIRRAPAITWDANAVPKGIVVFMDLDAGGRSSGDGRLPGPLGPALAGLWAGCAGGSLARCQVRIVPYTAPHPPRGTHRFAFVLLRQEFTWVRDVFETFVPKHNQEIPAIELMKWNFTRFLESNWPNWRRSNSPPAVAYNFFYLSGTDREKFLDPTRFPPWELPPAPPPPTLARAWARPPPPSISPPPLDWWGGNNDGKRPWEH